MYYVELRFTKHALLRMQERKISKDEVYEIFDRKILLLKRKEDIIIGKTVKDRSLTLIINPQKHSLITIWPSNSKERRLYTKKIGESYA
jgi:hypothetical protein